MDQTSQPQPSATPTSGSRSKLFLIIGVVAVVVVILLLVAFGKGRKGESVRLLGDDIKVTVYAFGGKASNRVAVSVPFIDKTDEARFLNLGIDLSGDDQFTADEWILKNVPVEPRKDKRNNFPFVAPSDLGEELHVRVLLSREKINEGVWTGTLKRGIEEKEKHARPETYDFGALMDFSKVKNPEESMTGFGSAVQAAEPATEASRPGQAPDLTQRPTECAPTAAANSIMSLAEEHGRPLTDLPSPTDIVDGLKGDMLWTPADGVFPDNFVKGKNLWAAKNGLPIRTEKVGDAQGASTLEKVLDSMANGSAAEVRIRFGQGGRTVGGHMVTVTGVRTSGGQSFIDVSDPKTPAGTETYEVNGNEIVGYPFEGETLLGWGFVQTWEGAPGGGKLEPLTDEEVRGIKEFVGEKQKVKVINVRGKKIPLGEVHVGKGPECDSQANQIPHYHANNPAGAKALDGTIVSDPGGCGYGKVQNVPVEEVEVQASPPPASAVPKAPGGVIKVCGLPGGEPCPKR